MERSIFTFLDHLDSINYNSENFRSWRTFFLKKTVRSLKIYRSQRDESLSDKQIAWVMYHLEHSIKALSTVREIEIAEHILNEFSQNMLSQITSAIKKYRSNLNIEIKAWGHDKAENFWLDTQAIRNHTTSVYLVNRCNIVGHIVKPMETISIYNSLQKLEFWVRLEPTDDFSIFKQLKICTQLKEFRLRLDFDVDLQKVSKKFLVNLKLPKSLTYFNLYISGLRFYWVGDLPRSK